MSHKQLHASCELLILHLKSLKSSVHTAMIKVLISTDSELVFFQY